jgi:alkylhydroperoxidase family enzyme
MRINPIQAEKWTPEFVDTIMQLAPADANQSTADRKQPSGANVLGTLAHHPVLAQAFLSFNGHLLNTTTLSARQRELLVLRVAVLKKSNYEWCQHLIIARGAGLSESEIAAVAYGAESPLLAGLDAALVRSVDDVIERGGLTDETWSALAAKLDTAQILDLLYTIGCYVMLAAVIQSLGLELEDDLRDVLAGTYGT